MVAITVVLVPVRQRRLRSFAAPNPWANQAQTRWDLNLYRVVMEAAASKAEWAAIRPASDAATDPAGDPLPGSRPLRQNEAIGFEPSGGDGYHILPRALHEAWHAGEVPDTRLPAILAALEPRLRKEDFFILRRKTVMWVLAVFMAAAALTVLVAAWVFLPGEAHVMRYMEETTFLAEPPVTRNVILHGGFAVTPIEPVDAASLHAAAGFNLPSGLDTLGWYAATDGTRHLIVYTARGSPQIRPQMSAYGPVVPPATIGLDPARAAASAHADPSLVFVQHGGWADAGDPSGLAHETWVVPAIAGIFAAASAAMLLALVRTRRRDRSLRRAIAVIMQQETVRP